jgi:AsmA protein
MKPRHPTWRTPWRIGLLAIVAVIVLAAGAGGIFLASFDPNRLKPRIIEAVKHATGRDLSLNGKIGFKLSLQPTIEARSVAFSNPDGFSRPQMATLDRLQLKLGLLPLLSHRIEIVSLTLIHPDILLETNAAGRPNWQLRPDGSQPTPAATGPQSTSQAGSGDRTRVSAAAVSIENGTLAYRDDRTNKVTTLGLPTLEAAAASPDAPLHVETDAVYNGTGFNLVADTGSLTRLQDSAATTPWPLKLAVTAAGATLVADGSLTQPLLAKGYELAVNGVVPDLSALAPLLPGMTLPPLHDVHFAAKLADRGSEWPAVSALTLRAGASDLGAQVAGLSLNKLDIVGSALDQPIKVDVDARLAGAPLVLAAILGPPSLLMPGAKPMPFPVDVTARAAGATLTAKGEVADGVALTGANVALTAQIPDLAALSPLARAALPPLKSIAFQGTLIDAAGGLRNGMTLHAFRLSTPDADLAGEAQLALQPRTSLTATLASNHIDLDALQAAVDQTPAPAAQPGAQTPNQPEAKPAPRKRADRIFSDQPIPFDQLRRADADLHLTVGTLHSGGTDYKAIATHTMLSGGKLTVDQLSASLPPHGRVDAKLSADASQPTPPLHVSLHASGLALKSVLALLGQPPYANGNLDVYAEIDGAGSSPHAIASSVDGSLGLETAGGTIDNRLLGSILGKVMDPLNALDLVGRGGTSELRCFGARLDVRHGVGTIGALGLSSSLLTMTGSGTINLGEETLGLTLRPEARIAGTPLVVPIAVTGPIQAPKVAVSKLGTAESNVGSVAGAIAGNATPLGLLGGLLGADKLLGGGGGDVCGPVLTAARGGKLPQDGEATHGKAPNPILSNPAAVLRNLLR